jgi:hypothetical protein
MGTYAKGELDGVPTFIPAPADRETTSKVAKTVVKAV